MTTMDVLLILTAGVGLGIWGTFDWFHYRRTDHERALLEELRATRAAQRLTRAAWEVRRLADTLLDDPADASEASERVPFDQDAEGSGGDGVTAGS